MEFERFSSSLRDPRLTYFKIKLILINCQEIKLVSYNIFKKITLD